MTHQDVVNDRLEEMRKALPFKVEIGLRASHKYPWEYLHHKALEYAKAYYTTMVEKQPSQWHPNDFKRFVFRPRRIEIEDTRNCVKAPILSFRTQEEQLQYMSGFLRCYDLHTRGW